MSDPKKPERLSGERRERIRQQNSERYLVHDARISWVWELLAEVDALTAELEERTRERDEAVYELDRLHEAARQVIQSPGSATALSVLENGVNYLDKKGPADDR